MSLILRYDYARDIRNHQFDEVAKALREGRLTPEEIDLLADYLVGKLKRRKGRPVSDDTWDLAQYLYSACQSLRKYGKTSEEVAAFVSENFAEHGKEVLSLLKGQGLSRKSAITKLAEIHIMGEKNVERLVDLGRKIDEFESERRAEEEW